MTGIGHHSILNHCFQWFSSLWSRGFRVSGAARAFVLGVAVCALTACASHPHRSFYGPAPGSYFAVTVRSGDTLSEIALRHRVDEDDIAAMNRLRNKHDLHVGQALRIPAYGRVARNTGTHRRNATARATMPRRTTTAATATASTTTRTT